MHLRQVAYARRARPCGELSLPGGESKIAATIEREAELQRIDALLADARARQGHAAVIEAPSGMGRSTLLAETRERATSLGMTVLEATGSELEVGYPFGTMLRLIDGWRMHASPEDRDTLFTGQARLAAPLLDDDAGTGTVSTEFSIIHGLYWCLVNLSDMNPTVILIDDAHWADDESLRCLNYLVIRLADLPVVIVIAVRTGDTRADSSLVQHLIASTDFDPIRPGPLTLPAVATLLNTLSPALECTPDVLHRCREVTGGSPFLLHELAATIRTEGPAWLDSEPEHLESFAPDTVRRQVLHRLSQLGSAAVELARAFAILGTAARLDLAAQLAGLDEATAAAELDRLVAAQVLLDDPHPRYRYPMVRTAVREDLLPGQLAALHAASATLLHAAGESSEVVAHHLMLGLTVTDDWAIDTLSHAARAAGRKASPDAAIRYIRHAVRLCPPGPRQVDLLTELGLLEATTGAIHAAAERLERALSMMDDPAQQARSLYSLGVTLCRAGRFAEGCAALEQCTQIATDHHPQLAMQSEALWAFISYYLYDADPRAMARLERLASTLAGHAAATTPERMVLGLRALRLSLTPGRTAEAAEMAQLTVEHGTESRSAASPVVANIAILALTVTEHFTQALAVADELHSTARAQASLPAIAEAGFIRSMAQFGAGEVTEAWISAQSALETVDGWHGLKPMATGILGLCLVERDQLAEAAALLTDAGAILSAIPRDNPAPGAWIHMAQGQLHLAQANPQDALTEFLAVGRVLAVCEATSPGVLRWSSAAGLAAHALGDLPMARRLVADELEAARSFGLRRAEANALRVSAVLEPDLQTRDALVQQALQLLEPYVPNLDLALTLIEQGRGLIDRGQLVEARAPLSLALSVSRRVGALTTSRVAREQLLAIGAKPRRTHTEGVRSMTPTELRVAEMAANGLTNREIAESLFLAKTTVSWHLRNVFRKLEIESRTDLKAALRIR